MKNLRPEPTEGQPAFRFHWNSPLVGRACHEVHASHQSHHIRDGVPYGPKGCLVKLNYQKTASGGSCARTCHDTKTYARDGGAPGKASRGALPPASQASRP